MKESLGLLGPATFQTEVQAAVHLDVPREELAGRAEFARALHRDVNLVVEMRERRVDRIWPLGGGPPEYVLLVMRRHNGWRRSQFGHDGRLCR